MYGEQIFCLMSKPLFRREVNITSLRSNFFPSRVYPLSEWKQKTFDVSTSLEMYLYPFWWFVYIISSLQRTSYPTLHLPLWFLPRAEVGIFSTFKTMISQKSPNHEAHPSRGTKARREDEHITKSRQYNGYPLKPYFCIVKLGFTEVYIIFLILLKKNIDCGYSLEPPHCGGSNDYSQSMFWAGIWKISEFFCLKIFLFLVAKLSIYLNRRVFVMK